MSSDSYRLDSLLEITSSKRIHMADYVPSGVPFYRGKEVIERAKGNSVSTELFITHAQYQEIKRKFGSPQDGDVLLTSVGTLGVAYFIDGDGDFYFKDGNVTWFRNFDPRVVPKYLYYWLTSPETQKRLDEVSIGSTQRALTISALKSLQVQLPSVDSQRAIVDMLDAVTNRITLLRETNATLEAIAQALFKSWFVDFDPVRAKMEGRTPEGMDEATAALFPDGFETSELGEVPRGWRVGKLGDVAALKGGKQLSKEAFSNSAPNPVFGGAGVMGHTAQRNATDFVITVGRVGAYCGQFFWHIGNAWVNNNASHVVPSRKISSEWLLLWLKSVNMDVIKKGAAQPFVSNGDIAKLSMIHPPIELIDAFGALVAPMFARSQLLVQQSVELASVRDTLLPRLISGQLRLSEAQAATEAALGGTLSV